MWVKKLNLFIFTHVPQAKLSLEFLSLSPRQTETAHSYRTVIFEIFFSLAEREGERITELKTALVTGFDKLHYLCNLYIFGLYFAVQKFSFKHGEVWRFFNLTNKTFTKR